MREAASAETAIGWSWIAEVVVREVVVVVVAAAAAAVVPDEDAAATVRRTSDYSVLMDRSQEERNVRR